MGIKSSTNAIKELKALCLPKKVITEVLNVARRNYMINNDNNDIGKDETDLLFDDETGVKESKLFPNVPIYNRSDYEYTNCTICAMHSLGLGCTKSIIEDIDYMLSLVGNVAKLRMIINERTIMIKQSKQKNISLKLLKKDNQPVG